MDSFIGTTAKYILENYSQPNDVCVVLPNRRAGLFLKKEIASSVNAPIWSPTIFSVEDFIFQLTDLQPADSAELLLALFRIVKASKGHEEDRFDEFCKWAPALLGDFNEVDMWMADPKALFTNLADIKEIESWSLGEETLTDFQKKYLHFWDQTGLWYNALRSEMLSRNKAWIGLSHRLVAENIAGNTRLSQWNNIVFAGFNALSSSQEKIFSVLSSGGKAKVLWDIDRYYLEDPMNEAGSFLRKYREKFFGAKTENDFPHVGDFLAGTKKNITLIAAARNVSQARAAAGFLQQEGKDFIADETAVVLADETLLIPALNSLPQRFSEVNITMGYPMRSTPVFTLLQILFSLQENATRFNIRSREGELKFYHHDVIRLLRHPYVVNSASHPDTLIEIIRQIGRRNLTFVTVSKLREIGGNKFQQEIWFEPWTSAEDCIDKLRLVIGQMKMVFNVREEWALDVEYLYQFHLALNKISSLVKDWKEFSTVSAIKNLLLQVFGTSTIPFSGEPLAGLQVMGMLETRCLDFKNVIIVSANEGVLPQQSSQHSFIMYDLRKAFGLPVHQQRDAITAYNFYRLMQRAENICIVYNTDQDTFGVKEKSRYVSQLIYELPKVNRQLTVRNIIAGAELDSSPVSDEISILSSEEIIKLAAEKAAKGFSPSLINLFRECRLRFYFRYIAGLQEEKEVEENVDQNTLGTIMHATLEKLYTPYLNQALQVEHIEAMKLLVASTVKESFRKLFPDEEADAGKNHLAGKIAVRYISGYLDQESERIKSQLVRKIENTVVGLEETLQCETTIGTTRVVYKGSADRIDKMGNITRLIDYKTGQVDEKELKIDSPEIFLQNDKQGKAFQLMMYAWLYMQAKDKSAVVQPGIISFRKNKKGFLHLETPSGQVVTEKSLGDFEKVLMEITKQILSPTTVFSQTENVQMCRTCEFNAICRR
jgi:ATP-dependent helicase/nuclease subunit B